MLTLTSTRKQRRELIEASNSADSVAAETDKAIKEFRAQVDEAEAKKVEGLVAELRELAIKAQGDSSGITGAMIKEKISETQTASLSLFQKVRSFSFSSSFLFFSRLLFLPLLAFPLLRSAVSFSLSFFALLISLFRFPSCLHCSRSTRSELPMPAHHPLPRLLLLRRSPPILPREETRRPKRRRGRSSRFPFLPFFLCYPCFDMIRHDTWFALRVPFFSFHSVLLPFYPKITAQFCLLSLSFSGPMMLFYVPNRSTFVLSPCSTFFMHYCQSLFLSHHHALPVRQRK